MRNRETSWPRSKRGEERSERRLVMSWRRYLLENDQETSPSTSNAGTDFYYVGYVACRGLTLIPTAYTVFRGPADPARKADLRSHPIDSTLLTCFPALLFASLSSALCSYAFLSTAFFLFCFFSWSTYCAYDRRIRITFSSTIDRKFGHTFSV